MFKAVSRALARKQNGEKGFTLIELLVVVVIIGILAAIAIPIFLNQRQGAWRSSVESDAHNAVTQIEQTSTANNGVIPAGVAATYANADGKNGKQTLGGTTQSITISNGNTLIITVASDGQSYKIQGNNTNLTGTGNTYNYDSSNGSGSWS